MRERMITRTIKTTSAYVMVTDINDINNPKIEYRFVRATGEITEEQMNKKAKKDVELEKGIIFNCIIEVTKEEHVYGMTEDDFLMWSHIIER